MKLVRPTAEGAEIVHVGRLSGGIYTEEFRYTDKGRELEMKLEHEKLPGGRLTAHGYLPRRDQPAARWDRQAAERSEGLRALLRDSARQG